MKKLLSVFLVAASLTAFGCGNAEKQDEEKKEATVTEEKHEAEHSEAPADSASHGETPADSAAAH
ncbi:hypothetical protein Ctha_2459 [Chloroherpeton thalassium ATCC 35110]|uniref:Lipoprotein n=1 Tax=Chloroherpeton thalassium (strain ATCC 35110 / GB-78) TaxID=517418 RepID=B3QXJ3_CHLT3|nr:hypothetical protein [Chloroherpeton thalassium]ACF14908.1 hypothetical protein Ctha_2459 [Chloroherpeton thalassium ATCC 35110]